MAWGDWKRFFGQTGKPVSMVVWCLAADFVFFGWRVEFIIYWRGWGGKFLGRFREGAYGRVETEKCIWLLRG